jgi:galactose oxidase
MKILRMFLGLALFLVIVPVPRAEGQEDPAKAGEWSKVLSWPVVAIHSHLLPNGKVLTWERKDDVLTTESYLWDPATGKFEKFLNEHASVFCSGHTFLPDGTLLVAGGHHYKDGFGEKTATFFDYKTLKWTRGEDMNAGRWYPTACALSNGEVVVVGGSVSGAEQPALNNLPQVWKTTGGWRDLTKADGEVLPLYPWLLLAPDGKVFYAGPETHTLFLDTAGTGGWSTGPRSEWGYRDYGSAVMYEPGKVLIVGGGDPPTETAELIDLNASPAQWKLTGSMKNKRRQFNATLLADGSVLATGGTSGRGFNNADGSVLEAELWNPAAGVWTTMASMSVRRIYHSTAVLLPDGRVLSAGGGMPPGTGCVPECDKDHFDAQIYSPPYLFKGARPAIDLAPESVTYGETFKVGTKDAATIKDVTWVRLGSVTHAFDQGQRFDRLRFSQTEGGLTVTAPVRPELSPPGHYMLFLINQDGVPSVARIVRIAASPAAASMPDVEVVDQDGRKLHFYRDLIQGKTVVVNFVFTSCSTFCPLMGRAFSALQDALGERLGKEVSLISVSIDPATDTPERMKAWGAQFGAKPGWTLVTGEKANVEVLLEAIRGPYGKSDHTAAILLGNIDRGQWRREFGLAAPSRYLEILAEMGEPSP